VDPLRVGRIRYTNDLPIYAAFDEGALAFPGLLYEEVPTRLNAALLNGDLDMSPISAAAYLEHRDTVAMLPELCIASPGATWSVLLISATPLERLNGCEIGVTSESASGRRLLHILLERRFGVQAKYRIVADPLAHARSGRPTLLIGDDAIDARVTLPAASIYDLGELWHAWTAHPAVYAVWAVRRTVLEERRDDVERALAALIAGRRWGNEHRESVVTRAQRIAPRPPGFYDAYYRTLQFTLDASVEAGLDRFATESLAIGAPVAVTRYEGDLTCH